MTQGNLACSFPLILNTAIQQQIVCCAHIRRLTPSSEDWLLESHEKSRFSWPTTLSWLERWYWRDFRFDGWYFRESSWASNHEKYQYSTAKLNQPRPSMAAPMHRGTYGTESVEINQFVGLPRQLKALRWFVCPHRAYRSACQTPPPSLHASPSLSSYQSSSILSKTNHLPSL